MKQRIFTLMAALVTLCLFIELSPPSLQNTSLSWINWDSLTGRNNFYFRKRQWLADARTIVAGVRFLYECGTATQSDPMDVVEAIHSPEPRSGISTNPIGMDATASGPPLGRIGLSRAQRIIGRTRMSFRYGLPPMFAFAEFPSNSASAPLFFDLETKSDVPRNPTELLQGSAQRNM
jgi:hypothetical protein